MQTSRPIHSPSVSCYQTQTDMRVAVTGADAGLREKKKENTRACVYVCLQRRTAAHKKKKKKVGDVET